MMPAPSLIAAIDRAAVLNPEKSAVRCDGESLTWAELGRRTRTLARRLQDAGVQRGDRVGILMDKSLETVIAMQAIMRAGAAWVPLDPAAPPSRHAFVVNDCNIGHLVTHERRRRSVRACLEAGGNVQHAWGLASGPDLSIGAIAWDAIHADPAEPDAVDLNREDLAYIIYTSGSTGVPKGIMHTHGSSLGYCENVIQIYALTAADRVSNQAPLHFDICIFDLLAAAMAGSTMVLIPDMYLKMPASFSQYLADERVSVFFTVPFALVQLIERGALESRDLSSLRAVLFGGEVMPTKYLRAWMQYRPEVRFNNMYGPAEVNGVTCYDVPPLDDHDDRPVPIGKAFPGTTCVIRDEQGNVSANGTGELLVSGPSRMTGYWGRPDLNAQAFWDDEEGRTFYCTGDLVESLPSGDYRFLGRADRQVKVRGYRIELDEIEAALISHDSVVEAAVVAVPEGATQRIEAHVQTNQPLGEDLAPTLSRYLRDRIAPYAVPSRFAEVPAFPRISSGKIDYLALRQSALEDGGSDLAQG